VETKIEVPEPVTQKKETTKMTKQDKLKASTRDKLKGLLAQTKSKQ